MKDPEDISRRALLVRISAAIAVGVASAEGCATTSRRSGVNDLSAMEAVARMTRGDLSAEAYAQALVERCSAEKSLNAFISFEPDKVLEEARRLDRARRTGVKSGPLFGIPIPVKDCVNTRDYPTTGGTPGLRNFRPGEDAPLVKKLRDSGAIVLGKTNMHELGWGWTSNNESFGAVRNPYDPTRIPGGSSGGTAVAVAARMAPLGLAEDTNGSIRVPAAMCGIMGLRPTTGRYPSGGCVPLSPVLDQLGPQARTISDLALFDSVVTGDWSPLQPLALRGLRLGIVREYWYADLDPDVERITGLALARLRDAGVEIVEIKLPELATVSFFFNLPIISHDVRVAGGQYLEEYRAGLTFEELVERTSPGIRGSLRQVLPAGNAYVTDSRYDDLIKNRLPEFRRRFQDCFSREGIAAFIFPTTATPALPIDIKDGDLVGGRRVSLYTALARNIVPAPAAGVPGLVLPAGLTASGLPVSIELDAPAGTDRALFALGAAVVDVLGPIPPPRIA
jgi:Asp-tRNA(Asn)/Glu-tRNA(Gln) amidotransferase A subunit family amidase